MNKKIILLILLAVLIIFNIGFFLYKRIESLKTKDCILELQKESFCIDNKKSISYKIKKKDTGGINCLEIAKSSNKDYSDFIISNNNITSTTSCSNCTLKSQSPIYQGDCNGSNILTYYEIQSKGKGGLTCIDLVKSLPSSINSNMFLEDENYVITSKPCRDCILDNKTIASCNGENVIVTYNIKQSPTNGGKNCIDRISELESSQGFSNFQVEYNKVKGFKECKDCILGPYNDSRCVNTRITRTYPIISEQINGGISCINKIKSNQQNINDGFNDINWIKMDNNTYTNDSKICEDCELGDPEISCTNNISTIKFLRIRNPPYSSGKSCIDVAKTYPQSEGYLNWTETVIGNQIYIIATKNC